MAEESEIIRYVNVDHPVKGYAEEVVKEFTQGKRKGEVFTKFVTIDEMNKALGSAATIEGV